MLGNHLTQHGTEKRIRAHLDYLEDLPRADMFGESEDNESQDNNTILVRSSLFRRAKHIYNFNLFVF